MPCRPDLELEVDGAVAERCLRFVRPGQQRRGQIFRSGDPAHPPAAAAGHGLDQERIANLPSCLDDPGDRLRAGGRGGFQGSRHDRNIDRAGDPSSSQLVAERGDRPTVRADEGESG